MEAFSEWEYYIGKDEFQLYFPEGNYNIQTLADWYKVIPTQSEKIAFYGDNVDLLKRHFEKFTHSSNIKTKMNNDMESNSFLTVWCLTIYNAERELVGFAAQEYLQKGPGEKKILYFDELKE